MEESGILYSYFNETPIVICSGHALGGSSECYKCIQDEKNQYCKNYIPMIIRVKEEDVKLITTPSIDDKL